MSLLDLRGMPLHERHRPVFAAFDGLSLGEQLELCDDRDLDSVQHLLEAARSGCYQWDTLQAAPGEWRPRLTKQAEMRDCAACACACGGERRGTC